MYIHIHVHDTRDHVLLRMRVRISAARLKLGRRARRPDMHVILSCCRLNLEASLTSELIAGLVSSQRLKVDHSDSLLVHLKKRGEQRNELFFNFEPALSHNVLTIIFFKPCDSGLVLYWLNARVIAINYIYIFFVCLKRVGSFSLPL